jgi:hypothetical protein
VKIYTGFALKFRKNKSGKLLIAFLFACVAQARSSGRTKPGGIRFYNPVIKIPFDYTLFSLLEGSFKTLGG